MSVDGRELGQTIIYSRDEELDEEEVTIMISQNAVKSLL